MAIRQRTTRSNRRVAATGAGGRQGRAIRAFAWLLAAVAILFSGTASALLDNGYKRPSSMHPLGTVIAVDLGNTNSCVAGYGHDGSMFHLCIPSWVAFPDDGGVLVGDDARNYAAVNPDAAAFSGFKRLLGKRVNKLYEGGFVQNVIDNLPYKVVEKDARPHIQMETKDGVVIRHLSIEAVTAAVFAKLKGMAEAHLGHKHKAAAVQLQHADADAVFTLPQQYCSDAARYAVLHTGRDAGLRAVRILDEPIAAAVAYGLHLHGKLRDGGNVLVLHVGGGTAEASVLTFADGVFEFLGGRLDPFLGGDDFDRSVVDHFVGLVRDRYGHDISGDRAALMKLGAACEDAKKALSGQDDRALVNVEALVDGVDLSETLTRAKFEELNHDLFLKVVELVDEVMSQAELGKNRELIDEVVLIGGSTMIPKVKELIRDYFDGKELKTELKPDEAVTFGATLLSHPSAGGYPCMGVNNRYQIGVPSDNCYAYDY